MGIDGECCACTQTVLKYGMPQRSMPALQAYAASAMPSTDFQYALMALMLLASRPMALVRALSHHVCVHAHGRKTYRP